MHGIPAVAWLAYIAKPLHALVDASGGPAAHDWYAANHHPQRSDGSCTRVPTVVNWIPTWLHVRTRLAVALWGAAPLTRGEAIGFAPLAVRAPLPACLLGAISVRLALQLRVLEDMDIGHNPLDGHLAAQRANVLNFTSIAADWTWVRRVGFKYVLQSGWPVFELLRRIQHHILPSRDVEKRITEGDWDSPCDAWIRLNDWWWIDRFPRDTVQLPGQGMKFLPVYELDKAVKDSGRDLTKVCPLAWATHYLIIAANVFRRPGMGCKFMDDFFVEVPPPDDKGIWTGLFLHKGARYMHNIKVVISSWWPVLTVLGQLSSTFVLHSPGYEYVRPFITGLAGPAAEDGIRPAIVEAGAHDGTDAETFARNFPEVDVWAFEAHPTVYTALEAKIEQCGEACQRVHTTECALGAEDKGAVPFFINKPVETNHSRGPDSFSSNWGTDSSSSLYRPAFNGSRFTTYQAQPVNVTLISLKQVAAEAGMGVVRFMDLDAEGGEFDILRGASDSMLERVYALKLEVRDQSRLLQGVPLFPEVREWLAARGLLLLFRRSGGDALFVRRDLALI